MDKLPNCGLRRIDRDFLMCYWGPDSNVTMTDHDCPHVDAVGLREFCTGPHMAPMADCRWYYDHWLLRCNSKVKEVVGKYVYNTICES